MTHPQNPPTNPLDKPAQASRRTLAVVVGHGRTEIVTLDPIEAARVSRLLADERAREGWA